MQQLKQSNRELATILAALNLWVDGSDSMRKRYAAIVTDGGEFEALSLAETELLNARLNNGGYVSPPAAQPSWAIHGPRELSGKTGFEKECLKLQLKFWINKLQSLLAEDTLQHTEDLQGTLETVLLIAHRANETAKHLLENK